MLENEDSEISQVRLPDHLKDLSFDHVSVGRPPVHSENWEERSFQTEVKQGILDAYKAGHLKSRLISPTGSGKTTMAVDLMIQLETPTLILAPGIAAVERFYQELISRGEKPLRLSKTNIHKLGSARFVVCTGQTLMPTKNKEGLMMSIPEDHFKNLWVDEAHHFFGKKMGQVPARFKAFHTYITATPDTASKSLANVAPHLAAEVKYQKLIDHFGYPNKRFFTHSVTGEDWDKVRVVANEVKFQDGNDGEVKGLNMPARYGILHNIIKSTMTGKSPGIAFMPSIKSSKHFIKRFVDSDPALKGKVKLVSGETGKTARNAILEEINRGELLCVLTTQAWAESVDIPRLKHVVMADSSASSWLKVQRIGRGTRKHPDKDNEVWIHDLVGHMSNGGKRAASLIRSLKPGLKKRRVQQGMCLDDSNLAPIPQEILDALNITTYEIPLSDWAYEVDFSILRDRPDLSFQLLRDFANAFGIPPLELLLNAEAYLQKDEHIECKIQNEEELSLYFRDLWNFIQLYQLKDILADLAFNSVEALTESFANEVAEVKTSNVVSMAKKHYHAESLACHNRENFVYTHDWQRRALEAIQACFKEFDTEFRYPFDVLRHNAKLSPQELKALMDNHDEFRELASINGIELASWGNDSLTIFLSDHYTEAVTMWHDDARSLRSLAYSHYWIEIEREIRPKVSVEFYERLKEAVNAGWSHLTIPASDIRDFGSELIKDIYYLLYLKKEESFEKNRALSCFREENGDWSIPLHYLKYDPQYEWSEPETTDELPEYTPSQVSYEMIWDFLKTEIANQRYSVCDGAIKFKFSRNDIYEAHLAHPMLRRLCIIEDLVNELKKQGINASWAYKRYTDEGYGKDRVLEAETMTLCIAPPGSEIKVYPSMDSKPMHKILSHPIPLPKVPYDQSFINALEEEISLAIQSINNLSGYGAKGVERSKELAKNWLVKNTCCSPDAKFEYADIMLGLYKGFRDIRFERPEDQAMWSELMRAYDLEVFEKFPDPDNFHSNFRNLLHEVADKQLKFLQRNAWVLKMAGTQYEFEPNENKIQRTRSIHSHLHFDVEVPPFFKIKKEKNGLGDFASAPGEPFKQTKQGKIYLGLIYDALERGNKTVRIPLTDSASREDLITLQNAFYSHGVWGLCLRPLRVGPNWVEVSLQGLENAIDRDAKPSGLIGRHTNTKKIGNHEFILRHGTAIGLRNAEGYVKIRQDGQSIESLTKTPVAQAQMKTQTECIRVLDFRTEAHKMQDRRITTISSHDDSHGKSAWRSVLIQQCPSEIIQSSGRFILLPGWGKEADAWLDAGVHEGRLVLVDREEENIAHLRRRYPFATVIHGDIRTQKTWFQIRRGGPVSGVSIDPYAGITKSFIDPLRRGLKRVALADQVYLALNLQGKIRGNSTSNEFFQDVRVRKKLGKDTNSIELGWHAVLPEFYKLPRGQKIHSGHYFGDSSKTIMSFAMGLAMK